jgi:hypothetical protein
MGKMKTKKTILFYLSGFLLTGIANSQVIDSLYEVGTWQGFRQCAVSFTFDDNTPNQLSVVMPMFDEYNFKMTFFTVINWGPNWTALQAAALNGHEIASHTVTHTKLNTLTDEQQIAEFKNSQDSINSHIQGQKCLTIAYPNCIPGNNAICEQYYIAARGCSGVIVSKTPSDFMNISSTVCGSEGSIQRTEDFNKKADDAFSSNGWVVFLIHAIDEEDGYSPTSSSELQGALNYLNQNDNEFWVSSFGNIARYIKERNSVSVKQNSEGDSLITFSVTDTLDNSIYNYPITIRRRLPKDWFSARISQNGKTFTSTIINDDEKNYVMFNVIPDSGDIQLIREEANQLPEGINNQVTEPRLRQNYPNPFNPITKINYSIFKNSYTSLKVYDLLGQEVKTLFEGVRHTGNYTAVFNAEGLSSGLYLYQLKANNIVKTRKFVLFK